jgi:hypothetical protein
VYARKRLAAASVVAFGLAFAVVLALGQALPSTTADPTPSASDAPTPTTTEAPPETTPETTPSEETPSEETPSEETPSEETPLPSESEPSRTPPAPDTPTSAGPRPVDLGPWLDGEPPTAAEVAELDPLLRELDPKVWEEGDRVHVCVQVPDGWRIVADWTATEGPIHCTSATSGEPPELELVRS